MKLETLAKVREGVMSNPKLKAKLESLPPKQQVELLTKLHQRMQNKFRFERLFKSEKGINSELSEVQAAITISDSKRDKTTDMKKIKSFVTYVVIIVVLGLSVVTVLQYFQLQKISKQVQKLESKAKDANWSINSVEGEIEDIKNNESDLESRIDDLENRQIVVTYSR